MANEIANRLISDLMADFGLTREQAAGVAGNFAHETLNFTRMQERGTSRGGLGYAQWTGTRRTDFENWAAERGLDTGSYEANYGYLKHELETDPYERRQFMRVTAATTPEEAAQIVSNEFLRPGTPHLDRRIDLATQFAGPATPRVAPTPATPSLPLQSALLAASATDPNLQAALNARVNAPPMPRPRPQQPQSPLGAIDAAAPRQQSSAMAYIGPFTPQRQERSDLTMPGAVERSVQAASQATNPALQAALAARVGQGSRPPMPQSYAGQDRAAPSSSSSTSRPAPVPASIEDRVTARNSSPAPQPSTIGQAPTTRVVQSVPMPASRPQSYAGQDRAPPRPAAPASTRTATPTGQTEMQRLASIYGGGGPTRPPMPSNEDRLPPTPDIPDLSAGPPIRSNNPIQIVPNPTQTAHTNSAPKDFTGQYDQFGNPVFKPSAPAPVTRVAGATPPVPMPRPTSVATQLDVKPPMPTSYVPSKPAQPVQPTISGAVAPVPMPRLNRPGIFGNPQLFGRDVPLPGVLGMIQGATQAMANASGPFNNGADNLLYNAMRGGDFNTPGAATHIGTNGYLYAPKPGGGFINVGRANPAMSNADLYASRRPRNRQNAAERMESNGSRFDSGSDSIFGS